MSYNCLISILMITYSLLIPIAFSIGDTEVAHICLNNTKPFTIAYNQSRALVVLNLMINTASNTSKGFRTASYAWPLPDEKANGLALCRGDVSLDNCKACVNNASQTVVDTDHCPNNRSAMIWRDFCFLKYMDVDFFGTIDFNNKLVFVSKGEYLINSTDAFDNFMGDLSQTAIQSTMFYTQGTTYISIYDDCDGCVPNDRVVNVTMYVVAQCTRDLSKDDCKACLDDALGDLPLPDEGYKGAKILYGSCNIRYEKYNFLSD